MKPSTLLSLLGVSAVAYMSTPLALAKPPQSIHLEPIGSVAAGSFATSAAEIAAHDPIAQRLFVVNAQAAQVDIVDISDPQHPAIIGDVQVKEWGAVANSVSVYDGVLAVAVEAADKTDLGHVVFFDRELQFLAAVEVGALPDMLTFTPNGGYVLVANEGEPKPDYSYDPEGSISVIDVRGGVAFLTQANVRTADFNAIAIIDIPSATVLAIKPLGTKNHNLPVMASMPATEIMRSTSPTGH